MFDKLDDLPNAKPTGHRARYFVADQITENGRISAVPFHRRPHHPRYLVPDFSVAQKFDVLFPRQGDEHTHSEGGALFEEPLRRWMINPDNVQSDFTHQSKIRIRLFRAAEIISIRVRFERPVGHAFDEEFAVAFEKEFRGRANSCLDRSRHNERRASPTISAVREMSSVVCAVEMNPVSNWEGAK